MTKENYFLSADFQANPNVTAGATGGRTPKFSDTLTLFQPIAHHWRGRT